MKGDVGSNWIKISHSTLFRKSRVKSSLVALSVDKDSFLYYFLRDYGFVDWDKILNLIDGESGKKIFSKSHVLFRHKNKLVLREINQISDRKFIIEKFEIRSRYTFAA